MHPPKSHPPLRDWRSYRSRHSAIVIGFCIALCTVLSLTGCWNRKTNVAQPKPSNKTPTAQPNRPNAPQVPVVNKSSHERMRDLLQAIASRTDQEHLYIGDRQARLLRKELKQLPLNAPVFNRVVLLTDLGQEELNVDNLDAGIKALEQAVSLFDQIKHPDPKLKAQFKNRLVFTLGTAYMRLGETQNCCLHYSGQSCIVPIQGDGIHTNREGSEKAIRCFREVLDRKTDVKVEQVKIHEPSRWLMNIAYMTLGEYPDKVPPEHLIPPSFFKSNVEFPRFENVYPNLNLNTFNLSGGAILDDFNNDGYIDILTSSYDSSSQTQLFVNNQDGSFRETTQEANLEGFFGGLTMVQGDYDNDGDLDVFIPRGAWLKQWGRHPNSLLRNDGGKFTDVTLDVGLGDVHYPTKTAAWADYDNDGDLDLYVGNETTPGEIDAPAQLFRNDDGKFTDVAKQAGLDEPLFAMGAVWGDFDHDRYPDLWVSNGGDNRLYHNNGDGTFTDVAKRLGLANPQASFPTWFWDFDNDGHLDIYVGCSSGHVGIQALQLRGEDVSDLSLSLRQLKTEVKLELAALYQGDGAGGFVDVAKEQGIAFPTLPMGANFGDLNNDGCLDFYLGTGDIYYSELMPNLMYLNQNGKAGQRGFVDVTMSGGFGHLQKGHSVAFADLDQDGDQDVYMQMGGAYRSDKFNDALYENPGFGNNWLAVQLRGVTSNRGGIGARLHVRVKTKSGELRDIYRHVNSGGSFGANPLRQHLGLGQAESIEWLKVYWPTSDTTQTFNNVPSNQVIVVTEDKATWKTLELKRAEFPTFQAE